MPTNRFDFSQYQPDWGDDSSSDLEELALPQDLVARIEKEQGAPLSPEQRKALGQQITDDMKTTGMTFDTEIGKRGPTPTGSKFDFSSYDPQGGDEWTPAPQTKAAVVLPQKAEPTDTTWGQDFDRFGAEVTDSLSNFFPKADVQSRIQSAQDIIKAGENGGYYQYDGADDTKGRFIPVTQADVEHAKRSLITTATESAVLRKKSDEFLAGYPQSNEQKAYQQGRSKDTSLAGTIENMADHKGAVASSMLTGVIDFAPTILAGAVDPGLGVAAGIAQMAGGTYGDSSARFLASKGIDPSDTAAVQAFYSDPKNVDAALHYTNIHTAYMAGVGAALPIVGKATNAVLPVTKSVAAEVAMKTAANTATAGGTFVAGATAANAATGDETTGQEVIDSATAGLPFVLKDMAGYHEGAVKERARRGIDATLAAQDAARHTGTALDNKAAIEEAQNLKNRMERAKAEGDKKNAFNEYEKSKLPTGAEAQAAADKQEADYRNQELEREYAGKTRLEKFPDGSMEQVPLNPPQEWTPEKVKAEREQAAQAEAERVDRVEVGKLTEFLRKRQELAAKKASDANSATEKAARTAEGKRRREVADQLNAENPGADPASLVPELRKRLAEPVTPEKASVEPAKPVTPEKPAEEATAPLTDKEAEDLARDSGMYIPVKEAANKAGIDTGSTSHDSLDAMPGKDEKGNKTPGFWPRLHATIKALHERGLTDKTARAGVDVARQGKLVIVPSAKSVNHDNKGQASYQFRDGKMYVYMDKVAAGDEVKTLIEAASHEAVHRLKRTPSDSRGATIAALLSPETHEKVSNAIVKGTATGNKLAVAAVERGLRGAKHAQAEAVKRGKPLSEAEVQKIAEEETVAYFVQEAVAAKQARQGFGRMGGAVSDILRGVKLGVKESLGIDFQPTIEDLAHVSQDVLGEVAKDTTGPELQAGSADMIGGEGGKEFAKAKFIYKGVRDGKLRYEFSDEKAKFHPDDSEGMKALLSGKTVKLGDILDHPDLYKNYPDAKDINVTFAEGMGKVPASFNSETNTVNLNKTYLGHEDTTLSTTLHEVQHWIQDKEGFVSGANSKSFISKVVTRERDDAQQKFTDFMNGFKLQRAVESLPESARRIWDAQVARWNKDGGLTIEDLATKFLDFNYGSNSTNRFVQEDNARYYSLRTDVKTTADKYKAEEDRAFALYLRDYGEAEARNTQYRRLFNDEQRAAEQPESTMKKDSYGVDVADTVDTSKLRPGQAISNSESKPESMDSLDSEEPLKDRKGSPRLAGETEAQWDERIAKDNVGPLKKAFNALFGVDAQKEHGRQIIVGTLAGRDRQYTTAERELSKFKTYFDKLTEEQRLKLNDDWENGREITDPTAKAMFDTINPLFKDAIDYIKEHDPSILKKLREFYLPHVWKKPSKAASFFQTKGPLAGPKSFAKTRRWPTMKEAMESGLEPVTTNPAELAMLKYGELLKYAGLLHMKDELKKRGWLVKAEEHGAPPTGYAAVRDPSFNNTYVPEPIARDLNNYLSRGLTDVPGFKGIRYLENLMVAGKLGWSGFHAGFTTMDNFVTHMEVAGRRMLSGDINGGLMGMLKAPLSVVQSPYEGGALTKRFTGQDATTEKQKRRWKYLGGVDEHTDALLDLVEKGGGRAFMDASEWNAGLPKMLQAIRQRKLGAAGKYTLPAIADASGWLIHRKLVPAQKAAARVLMLKFELDRFAEKLGKEKGDYTGIIEAMHPDAAAQISRKVSNLIDDRLGHMAYDNQFWNAYAKHMAQLVIMAPGWVSGTFKTITGGVSDMRRLVSPEKIIGPLDKAGKVNDAKFGRLTSRTANLVALSMLTAAASGAFMYMMTGQWPESPKDYVHPKTGRKNADGTDERISWPTYAKEHYALATHPVKEVLGKLNQPLISTVWDLLNNADYTNTEIYDSKGPVGKQAKEIAGYIGEGFYKPISATNFSKADKLDALNAGTPGKNKFLRAASMIGMTSAPAEVDQSDAEHFINEKYFDSFAKGTLSRAAKERFTAKAEAVAQLRRGEKPDLSTWSAEERKAIRKDATVETFAKRFAGIRGDRALEDRLEAWDLATPEERTKYDMKATLLKNARKQIAAISDPEKKAEIQKRINEIRNQ